ncbi:replication factor C small subunit [Candidatus Woesearchaeota archaeon]|nr:replication factor C small subunit [Candidatus Woesearchaeota archaeon]MBW3006021.1 replication factor C small subunit [Candidatus Woesearchaeota archaeon]
MWTEKYRPSSFDEIKGQQEIVSKVKAFVEQKNLPHLLFAGPAGIGKSTLALVTAKQMFGSEWRQNFLELNASDERGIDVVRVKVKDFARTKAIGDVPFKIIFLDECDALTRDAQQALRRTMENYAATCRFILACNYSSKIIDPIQSRCAMFRFRPLAKEHMLEIVNVIGQKESLKLDEVAKFALIEVSGGDCRKLENVMQSCASITDNITQDVVYSMASTAQPQEIKDLLDIAIKGDFLVARKQLLDIMLRYGLSGLDVIKQIQKEVWDLDIGARQKVALIDKCGEIEFRLVEGSDEYLQLEALLAQICAVKN